jgi:Protein of unknown function (DUF3429)
MTLPSLPDDSLNSIIPPIVKWLGYGGLLPFVSLAVAAWVDSSHSSLWREALLGYGAVILSFVGALHWGLAMSLSGMSVKQQANCFLWSVVLALMAWAALLMTPKYACALLITGFLIHLWQDWHLVKTVNMPAWYLRMRLQLTTVACVSLLLGVF